jgi:hypothetical protein
LTPFFLVGGLSGEFLKTPLVALIEGKGMASEAIWLSYDLGIRGDYESLYAWLDQHDAKECGDSLAFFKYEYTHDLKAELKLDLEKAIDTKTKKIRIYIIWTQDGKQKGGFLFGGRKASPWFGHSSIETQDDEL